MKTFGPHSYAFLCNVPGTSRTLLFSDKAWVYERHFVQDCNDCSAAQWLGALHRRKRCTNLGFDSRRSFTCDVNNRVCQDNKIRTLVLLVLGTLYNYATLVSPIPRLTASQRRNRRLTPFRPIILIYKNLAN